MTRAVVTPIAGQAELSDADFVALAALIHRETGICLPPAKRALLQSRLYKRLKALGLAGFSEYRRLLESRADPAEPAELISAITTNVTRFHREAHHFDHLARSVLPELVARARRGARVRLWSAGCATGEEPYTLAFAVLAASPDAHALDIRILATDLDRTAIARAKAGIYPEAALAPLDPAMRGAHFERDVQTGDMRVTDAPRRLVRFGVLNLLDAWPFRGGFDVILCRNVVIYFDAETQDRLWRRFAAIQKRAGDRLYIGHSERLSERARAFYRLDGPGYVRTDLAADTPQPGQTSN
ncbi:protein-glutamate O-methyltransferase CheR [Rhodosalinus sp. 5P4]|uniref:CheR family methyltransferase n=1 Tax=Rhodosalinus sp. 5P4 TaxID=3239196 RepID=UPI0035237A0D